MFQGNLLKLFSYTKKHRKRLLYFFLQPFLSALRRNLPVIGLKSAVVAQPKVEEDSIWASKEYFRNYFLNNRDIYSSYADIRDICLDDDMNFESLKLLKDSINNQEDKELLEKLEKSIQKEISSYALEDIFKFVAMIKQHRYTCSVFKKEDKLMQYLDTELTQRELSHQDIFRVLHICHQLPYYKRFKFVIKKLCKFCKKISKLSPQEAVQVLYCMVHLSKYKLKSEIRCNFQSYLVEYIPKLNSDELGILALGLQKGGFGFSNKDIVSAIMNKTIEEMENMQMIPFHCICQFFCSTKFSNYKQIKELADFQERLIPYASKIKGASIVALARTGLELRFMNFSLWEILANNFKRDIRNYKLPQIQSFVEVTTVYNIQDEELLNLAIKEFVAKENICNMQWLIFFLSHLSHHQLYPENLLSRIFSKDFTTKFETMCNFTKVKRHYFLLNNSVEIEKPLHSFQLMADEKKKLLFKKIKYRLNKTDKLLIKNTTEVKKVLQDLYGETKVYLSRCVPDYLYGNVMRFDKNLEAQPIPGEFKMIEDFQIKRPLKDDYFWIFLMVYTKCKILTGTNSFIFEFQTQIRLLKTLGFKPVLLEKDLWKTCLKQNTVVKCLEDLINQSLQELQHGKSE